MHEKYENAATEERSISAALQKEVDRRSKPGAHRANTNEPMVAGMTIRAWQSVAEIAGNTCHVNGGSKSYPCDQCLERAEQLMRDTQKIARR